MSGFPPGYDPGSLMGGGGQQPPPAPPPARFNAGPQAGLLYQNPAAQQALLQQYLGIDPNNRSPLTQFMESMYSEHLRPWLGAMTMAGRRPEEVPQMIQEFANAALSGGFSDFMRGSVGGFLDNPTFTSNLARIPNQQAAQRRLEDILGFADVGMDPLVASGRAGAREAAGGQYALALAQGTAPGNRRLLDFILNDPQYWWMAGR